MEGKWSKMENGIDVGIEEWEMRKNEKVKVCVISHFTLICFKTFAKYNLSQVVKGDWIGSKPKKNIRSDAAKFAILIIYMASPRWVTIFSSSLLCHFVVALCGKIASSLRQPTMNNLIFFIFGHYAPS